MWSRHVQSSHMVSKANVATPSSAITEHHRRHGSIKWIWDSRRVFQVSPGRSGDRRLDDILELT